jgi:hypothetical protein
MPKTPNLRTWKVGMDSGKDVKSTGFLKGNAKPTGKMSESNSTTEYSVAKPPKSDLGGENRHQ